ncbi:MAG: capsule biosynthesis protein [Stenotrophobium sp.]
MNDPQLISDSLEPPRLLKKLMDWAKVHRGSLICIALPTLIAAIYYFFIAADLYASEARFVVQSPSQMQISGLAGFLGGGGFGRGGGDVYSVHDFILSRDAVATLQKQINLRTIFDRPEADYFSRFPSLFGSDSNEDFYRYYLRHVSVIYDTTTGISTLTVKAFRAQDAQKIAALLLDASEGMINRMNDRARKNTIKDADDQVQIAEKHVTDAEHNMLAYRSHETLLDPNKTSGAMFETMSKMQTELATLQLRRAELERSLPDSPLLPDVRQQIDALEWQIGGQKGRLAGGKESMAPKIAAYEQLLLRQEFSAKELTSALASLEVARSEARHQQIYLGRVVEANLPDKALYPKRFEAVLIVFVSCFLIYSIGFLLVAGVREHAQH